MAANNHRADDGLRDQGTIARRILELRDGRPPIEWPSPIVHDVPQALDDLSCRVERLGVVLGEAIGELHDVTTNLPAHGGQVEKHAVNRLHNNWLILEVAAEKLSEIERVVTATTTAAYGKAA